MGRGLVVLLLILPLASPAWGDGDHERARRALESGEVLPLRRILDVVETHYAGDVLEVELEREGGTWIYEIELLAPGGRIVEVTLDASTGELTGARGRHLERHGH